MAKKPASKPPERSPWAASVGPGDLDVAKREALLQLRIGRAAHLSAVAISAALALDALLLFVAVPRLPVLAGGDTGTVAALHSFFLILPIAAGLAVAAVGVVSKWEAFQIWPWEDHFSLNVAGLAVSTAVAVFYVLRIAGAGPAPHFPLYPTFVPLSLAGASLALVGSSATWRPWGGHQWTSAVTAVLPLAVVLFVFVPGHPSLMSSQGLAVALLVGAILYQTSGSFLHLVSSGTGPHEQAIVLTGQNRIVRLAGELRKREEAIQFREAALVKREADAETTDAGLRRARAAHTEREARLQKLEAADQGRTEALAAKERDVAGREAALDGQSRAVADKARELEVRTSALARQAPELAAREQRLAKLEGELARRDAALRQRGQGLDLRESGIADGESRISARRKEIEQKTADLLRREGEVAARERDTGTTPSSTPRLAKANADLAAREARAQHLKAILDEQNAQLGRRAKDVADQAKALETTVQQIAEKQALLSSREAALAQREGDLEDRLKVADDRRLQFETATRDYQGRLSEVGKMQVAAAQKGADVDQRLQTISQREKELAEREARLRAVSEEIERREGEVVLRERSVDADEAEVSLRRQEIAREGDLPFAGLLAVAAADRADAPGTSGPSSRTVRGRRRGPAPGGAGIVEAGLPTETGTLTPPSGRKYPDRLPTGSPRLDDLLLGGFPPRSHTVLVGDAFVGKEVALYAFIAEGLKRGEPILLVTAARSANEIGASLGVVVPQFREYEQMGNVTWVDASGAMSTPTPNRMLAKSSDDRAGILSALVAGAKRTEEVAKEGGFRVGFFGLSAVLAHSDERASFSFLQNVVGILKPRNALAMYALEAGALSEAQVESLLGLIDGAILFRQDRDRTFLSVKGFGDVATREWVEVRATNRALVIGSFALERIR